MLPADPPDFLDLAARKLDWIDARSRLLAGNVANADTPGYMPRDLAPFVASVANARLALRRTDPNDMVGGGETEAIGIEPSSSMAGETSPDGNGVSLDEQMRLLASNDQDQNLVTTLYHRYAGMTDLALGVSG